MTGTAGSASEALFWGLILILALVLLGVGIWLLRRLVFAGRSQTRDEFLSLHHLRDLRAKSQITEEEFQRLRSKAIESARFAGNDPPGASSAHRGQGPLTGD